MNEVTVFLAQLMGPVLGLVGLGMLLSSKFYTKAFKEFSKQGFPLVFMTMTMIAAGMAIVVKHFMWGSLAEVLVTIVGLGMLVKGALLAVMPTAFNKMVDSLMSTDLFMFAGVVWAVGGGYLTYVGFMM